MGLNAMRTPTASLFKSPYGLSFPIDELIFVRRWAEERGLHMIVALDQLLETAEFEEMLILAPPDRKRRSLTIWRTMGSVFVQIPNGRPHAFVTIEEALASLKPAAAPKRSSLLRLFGTVKK
jgi:hypothetical protein